MANFEGKLNLNVETSEIEINGKFKLTEDELDSVAGGQNSDYYTTNVNIPNYADYETESISG